MKLLEYYLFNISTLKIDHYVTSKLISEPLSFFLTFLLLPLYSNAPVAKLIRIPNTSSYATLKI